MNKENRYLIDFDSLSAVNGGAHIYATDLNNTILFMNTTARHFFKDIMNINPDGRTLREVFLENEQAIQLAEAENQLVIATEQAQLFYNRIELAHSSRIDFITSKMPFYNTDNTLAGVLGISHYLEKRSSLPAYQKGLTKREIECLNLLLDRVSYKEIAETLNISPRTVESYLTNAKNKLACETSNDLLDTLNNMSLRTKINEMNQMTSANLTSNKISSAIKKVKQRKST